MSKQNLGIYISNMADVVQLKEIADCINHCVENKIFSDYSLFYDNIAYNPFKMKCGVFNATDIWNFSGKLITTSLSSTLTALKIVNGIEIHYFYGWENKVNALHLISLLQNKICIFSKNEESKNDIYRKTGIDSTLCANFTTLIKEINKDGN